MKRFLLFLLLTTSALASTTLTINVSSFTGGAQPGAYVRADLQQCVGAVIPGTGQIIQQSQNFTANSGTVTAILYDNTSQISCPDALAGAEHNSYYTFTFVYQGNNTLIGSYQLFPGTFNLAGLTPLNGPVQIIPGTGDTTYLRLDGTNSLTAPLALTADPTTPLGAVTKQYDDLKLPLAGGTMGGPLVLAADPTTALQAVTKQYADAKAPTINVRVPGLVAFGDSICAYTGSSLPTASFMSLLAAQFGGPLQNDCVSGYWIQSEPGEMYPNVAYPTQGTNPITLEEGGKNDATFCAANANCLANSQLSLVTVLTHRGSANIVPANNCTATGTWVADPVFAGSRSSTTSGSTLTCSITSYGAGGAIGVPYRVYNGDGGTATVRIDGVLQATTITTAGVGGYNPGVSTYFYAFTNMYPVAAGTHTVVITVTSATSAGNFISIPDVVSNPNPLGYFAAPMVGSMEVIPYSAETPYPNTWTAGMNAMKQATVTTLQGYGFNAVWLPVVNVPCANGAGCAGGFNAAAYIGNLPAAHDPDGLSCAGTTTDTVHPNDCGHKQIAQAILKDLGPVMGATGSPTAAQNIYSANHTLAVSDSVVYMSGAVTLTVPLLIGTQGPFFIVNIGTSTVLVSMGAGTNLDGAPSSFVNLYPGQSIQLVNYFSNWFTVGSNRVFAQPNQNVYAASHTIAVKGESVIYASGSSTTISLPNDAGNYGPFYITNQNAPGGAAVAIALLSGTTNENNIPATLAPGKSIILMDFSSNWWLEAGPTL